jgi:prepilin-type N-terminal cleavage/methylation domain-containing protein/prepilin-type processing-associated H-X9-DG protein
MTNHGLRARGFTLIELLIVIAIIAILAAILFPVFARARENARRASCQSNLKQIGLSFMQYSQDYDERYPAAESTNANVVPYGWDKKLEPYVGQKVGGPASGIFLCPSDYITRHTNTPPFDPRTYAMIFPGGSSFFGSGPFGGPGLGMAGRKSLSGSNDRPDIGIALSEVGAPAETLIVAEMPHARSSFGGNSRLVTMRPYAPTTDYSQARNDSTQVPTPIHFDGWNYLFVDGHVKWLRPERTIDLNPNDGAVGQLSWPYGMWTINEND